MHVPQLGEYQFIITGNISSLLLRFFKSFFFFLCFRSTLFFVCVSIWWIYGEEIMRKKCTTINSCVISNTNQAHANKTTERTSNEWNSVVELSFFSSDCTHTRICPDSRAIFSENTESKRVSGWDKKKHALWIRNNSKQRVLPPSIARASEKELRTLFINHELASKQYAFAIVFAISIVFRSSNVLVFDSACTQTSFGRCTQTANSCFAFFFLSRKTTGSTFRFSSSALSPVAIMLYLRIIYLCLAWLPFRMYFVDNVCKHTSCTNSISTSAQTNLTPPLIVALYRKPHSGKKMRARAYK